MWYHCSAWFRKVPVVKIKRVLNLNNLGVDIWTMAFKYGKVPHLTKTQAGKCGEDCIW